jgi:hypothetical protein
MVNRIKPLDWDKDPFVPTGASSEYIKFLYFSATKPLMHLSKYIIPDISFAHNLFSRYIQTFKFQHFEKFWKNISRRSQSCTLSLCKISEWNIIYSRLDKNEKITQEDETTFSMHSSSLFSRTKSDFVIFAEPKNTTYFVLENYTLIEYNIFHIMVFFQKYLEMFEFVFLELQILSSMELKLHTSENSI